MKRIGRILLYGVSWFFAIAVSALETILIWSWLRGTLYVMKFGAAENPYAAEDAEITGFCALVLLPLVLAAWAWILFQHKTRASDARPKK